LFYPEKRPFFLEGNEIYTVAGTQSSDIDPFVSVVHTRTIANPLVGAKLSGKIDATNTVAVLYGMDRVVPEETAVYGKHAHVPVLRYKHALAEDSYLGAIYTGREVQDHGNRVFGVDGMLRMTKSSMLEFNGLYSSTKSDAAIGQTPGHSIGLKYAYGTRDLDYYVSVNQISEDFATETGYLTRNGVMGIAGLVRPKLYPQSSVIQRIAIDFFSGQTFDRFSNMWETLNYIAVGPSFLGSMNGLLRYAYATEIFAGQKFRTSTAQVGVSGLLTRQVRISLVLRSGDAVYYSATPYQGTTKRVSATVIYQPTENIELNTSFVYSDFHRSSDGERIYEYPIIREKLTYQMNRYLFFRGIAEYNKFRRRLLTDFLASFTYIPGTVAHVGYGSIYERIQWDEPNSRYINADPFLESQRGFFFKVSYLWRL
jgi:hypothetical protein